MTSICPNCPQGLTRPILEAGDMVLVPDVPSPSAVSGKTIAKWRKVRCLELALAGHSYDEIAEEVGYANRGTAWRAVQDALGSEVSKLAEEYRDLELARLDALQTAHWPDAVSGSVRSADLVLRVMDRRMKLLRLDQPPKEQRPPVLIVDAPVGDTEGYIRQLQAIDAMSEEQGVV